MSLSLLMSGYMPDSSLVPSSNTNGLIWKCSEHLQYVIWHCLFPVKQQDTQSNWWEAKACHCTVSECATWGTKTIFCHLKDVSCHVCVNIYHCSNRS